MIKEISKSSKLKLASAVAMTTTIIVISVSFVAFPGMTVAQTDKDSPDVQAYVKEYQRVWNTHDLTKLGAFFTEDADFVMGNLPLIRGQEAIQNWWGNYFKRQEPERRGTFEVKSVKIITPDVALVNITSTTGGLDTQGKELTTRKARGTWVLIKKNGNWFITAIRGMPSEEDRIIRGGNK